MGHGVGSNERSPWRRPVSPLHGRLSQRVPVPRLFHRPRRLPPTPITRRSGRLLSSPLASRGELEKAIPLRSKPRKTHSRHTRHSPGSGHSRSLARHYCIYIALHFFLLRNANWCTPITCTHDQAYIYIYICNVVTK